MAAIVSACDPKAIYHIGMADRGGFSEPVGVEGFPQCYRGLLVLGCACGWLLFERAFAASAGTIPQCAAAILRVCCCILFLKCIF